MCRIPNTSTCALVGLALSVPMFSLLIRPEPQVQPPAVGAAQEQAEDPLRGMWMRYEGRGEGDPLRFWYFHGDGKGLYRYGKVGLANTHSFDYSVGKGGEVSLRFRKRGEEHRLKATIEQDEHGTWLRFDEDPREPGARYRKVESDLDAAKLGDEPTAKKGIGDRIWIDYRNLATGGAEFHMYQLAATAIDGRGVGWFHRGDFDDWSTESLTYRIDGDRLELFFDLRQEEGHTEFRVVAGERGRELWLEEDPRDYWAMHRYRDGGRSFGSAAFEPIVALERVLAAEP
jgi:hypothetical protein